MTVLDRLANRKTLKSAELAERTAQERDQASARQAEIGALRTKAAALDEEIRAGIVANALDNADNSRAITKTRAEHRAVVATIEALTERNATALLVIAELESRHHAALVDENTAQRRRLAEEYDGYAARIRALLLEAGALQEKAMRVRHEEGELSCAICVQRAGGLAAETMIVYRPLGPPLEHLAEGYAAVDSGNRDLARLMKMG